MSQNVVFILLIFMVGASLGSFINVVVYRWPLGLSVVRPRSFCPECRNLVSVIGLVPVLGYFFVRGKCTSCATKISFQYPFIEFVSGLIFVLAYLFHPYPRSVFVWQSYLPLVSFLILIYTGLPVTLIDKKHRLIPDMITLPFAACGIVLSFFSPLVSWQDSLLGAMFGFLLPWVVGIIFEKWRGIEGIGGGDIKYLCMIGAFLGVRGMLLTLVTASLLGVIFGSLIMYSKHHTEPSERLQSIPFGPYLAVSACILSWCQALGI